MLVFVGCNYERLPFVGYRDAFRETQNAEPRIQFRFADVRITNKVIMEKVREEILHCDAGLYDVTFRNPNVMMELGIAVGANKSWHILYNPAADTKTLSIRGWFDRKNTQLPANLRGYEYLEYTDKDQLKATLSTWSAQTLERASRETKTRWESAAAEMTALLVKEPGLKIGEIGSRLGQHVAMVRLTLSELRKQRVLRTDGRGPATRYFVSGQARRRLSATPIMVDGDPREGPAIVRE